MLKKITILIITSLTLACSKTEIKNFTPRNTQTTDFVYLSNNNFVLNDSVWFPLMLNYKTDVKNNSLCPTYYYGNGTFDEHFTQISGWGFNSIRVCMDVMSDDVDTSTLFSSIEAMLNTAQKDGLRVMLLIKPPLNEKRKNFTIGLLKHFANNSTIWAYDFMNEPLYFDPAESRDKLEAYNIVVSWREMMEKYAPHQLFTIAFAEPIKVFEWDPSILPVDFVEMHTYHPLRVASEMYWYGHFVGKPWIVGETNLPADNDSVPYVWQCHFLQESFACAVNNGAIGFGIWEFQDCLQGTNFEAWYTGLKDANGNEKPATKIIKTLTPKTSKSTLPLNYFNMLGYKNLAVTGTIIDKKNHKPIEGAVVRGWNNDWSIGVNTFTDKDGHFSLISNDICCHFEISATGYDKLKFDKILNFHVSTALLDQKLEYQQISYQGFLESDSSLLKFKKEKFNVHPQYSSLGTLSLKQLK